MRPSGTASAAAGHRKPRRSTGGRRGPPALLPESPTARWPSVRLTRSTRSRARGEALALRVEPLHACFVGHEHRISEADEEAGLDHAHHPTDALLQPSGIKDSAEAAVENAITTVGDESLAGGTTAQTDPGAEPFQSPLRCLQAEGDDLHWHRSLGAELIHQLCPVHDDHEPLARRGDNLLVQERAAQSLDQIERAPLHLVGA